MIAPQQLTPPLGACILEWRKMERSMSTEDKAAQEAPGLERLSEELEEALARVHGATEGLPPLGELAAVLEAMAGLAQMAAVVQSLR
jgi:hypothetical protein